MKGLSMIPDLNLTVPSALNFENDEGNCLLAAVDLYSTDSPRRRVAMVQGNVQVYQYDMLTLIPEWSERHGIESIQYPLDLPYENFMDSNAWALSINPSNERYILRFNTNFPGGNTYTNQYPAGAFGIWYMCPHLFDPATNDSSIPGRHEEAVSQLAASMMLELAANKASQYSDRQILENKDMGSFGSRLQAQADKAKETYLRLIGKDAVAFQPVWVDWDVNSDTGWMPFHPTNLR
jgi:hypothetical protein